MSVVAIKRILFQGHLKKLFHRTLHVNTLKEKENQMKKVLASLIVMLMISVSAYGSVGYMPSPYVRFWDATGTRLLTSGYVVTCAAGTTCGCTSFTAKTTYTDSTGIVPNTNPVLLDSTGSASIWYDGLAKITICDRYGTVQKTIDNVPTVQLQAASTSATSTEWPVFSGTPTYISTTQFSVPGDYTTTFTAGRRLKITQTGGAAFYTVSSSSYGSSVTTVNVVKDLINLNSGISAITIGIMDPAYPSLPIQPIVSKTSNYSIAPTDCGKTIISVPTGTVTFTLFNASFAPSGCSIVSKNTGTWPLIISGTVDAISNPTLTQYGEIRTWSNGVSWYGRQDSKYLFDESGNLRSASTVTSPNSVVISGPTGTVAPGWLGTGTPTQSTFLRGDQTWATAPLSTISTSITTTVGIATMYGSLSGSAIGTSNTEEWLVPRGGAIQGLAARFLPSSEGMSVTVQVNDVDTIFTVASNSATVVTAYSYPGTSVIVNAGDLIRIKVVGNSAGAVFYAATIDFQ